MLARWQALEATYPDEMAWLKTFLRTQPTNTRITNGKCKKLKGDLKHLLQYDVGYSDRVRYSVDKANLEVKVVYAGPHP
jgi:hypothetical protein